MHDVAVIGLGGMGSSAALHLAKRGMRIIGFDQFSPPHDRGSTHGGTRLIRQAYFEHPDYVPLLRRAYELWYQLGEEWGSPLFHQVGLLEAGPPEGTLMQGIRRSATLHGLPIENLSHREAQDRFTGIVIPQELDIIFEPTAGYLDVETSVQAALTLARLHGATLHLNERVLGWEREGTGFVVKTASDLFRVKRLVIAGGPWAGSLLASLGLSLRILRKTLHWFAPKGNTYDAESGFPVFSSRPVIVTFTVSP